MNNNDDEWVLPPTYAYDLNDLKSKADAMADLIKNFSETSDPSEKEIYKELVKSLDKNEKPLLKHYIGLPYKPYKPEPKFENYHMVLENFYDGSLKPFDPYICYDLKPNQRPITSIYLKSALDELRWIDKTAWIEAHLHLIRKFLDPNVENNPYVLPVNTFNSETWKEYPFYEGIKYQIFSYFNQYGKSFFYEIFSKTKLRDYFTLYEDMDSLIMDAEICPYIPDSIRKKLEHKETKDEAFLEWVSLYVMRDYLPQELRDFEQNVNTLCSMLLLMNYFKDGILEQLKVDRSQNDFFYTIYRAICKEKMGIDKEFISLIKRACLERMFDLRNKIMHILRESPSLVDIIHYEAYSIRQKFKNSSFPQLTMEYILFNWNNVGFIGFQNEEIFDNPELLPLKEKIKTQKRFYDEIRKRVFRSAKDYYFFKARTNFDVSKNEFQVDEKAKNMEDRLDPSL